MKLEWREKLLHRAGIEKPDGRPLYQYRVTDEEFEMLKSALSDIADQASNNNALKHSLFSLAFRNLRGRVVASPLCRQLEMGGHI